MDGLVRQTDKPLFPDILWSRPLTRGRGGRLLAIGGNARGFAGIQAAHQLAEAAGVGECLVAMPDSLAKLVGDTPGAIFLPSSPSGSIGKSALGGLLLRSGECDGMLLGIDLTNNSETAVLTESLLQKYQKTLIVTEEALETLPSAATIATENEKAVIVGTMNALVSIANRNSLPIRVRPDKELIGRAELAQQAARASKASYVIIGREIIVAAGEKLSATPLRAAVPVSPALAAVFAPFLLQNVSRPFEALTTGAYVLTKAAADAKMPSYARIAAGVSEVLAAY